MKSKMCEEFEKGDVVGAEMDIGNRNIVCPWMQMRWEDTPAMDKRHRIFFFTDIISSSKLFLER